MALRNLSVDLQTRLQTFSVVMQVVSHHYNAHEMLSVPKLSGFSHVL